MAKYKGVPRVGKAKRISTKSASAGKKKFFCDAKDT